MKAVFGFALFWGASAFAKTHPVLVQFVERHNATLKWSQKEGELKRAVAPKELDEYLKYLRSEGLMVEQFQAARVDGDDLILENVRLKNVNFRPTRFEFRGRKAEISPENTITETHKYLMQFFLNQRPTAFSPWLPLAQAQEQIDRKASASKIRNLAAAISSALSWGEEAGPDKALKEALMIKSKNRRMSDLRVNCNNEDRETEIWLKRGGLNTRYKITWNDNATATIACVQDCEGYIFKEGAAGTPRSVVQPSGFQQLGKFDYTVNPLELCEEKSDCKEFARVGFFYCHDPKTQLATPTACCGIPNLAGQSGVGGAAAVK